MIINVIRFLLYICLILLPDFLLDYFKNLSLLRRYITKIYPSVLQYTPIIIYFHRYLQVITITLYNILFIKINILYILIRIVKF